MKENLINFHEYLAENSISQAELLTKYNSKYGRFDSSLVEEFSFVFSDLWAQEDGVEFIRWRIAALINNTYPWINFKANCKNRATVSPHGELYKTYKRLGF